MEALIEDIVVCSKNLSSGRAHLEHDFATRRVCADALSVFLQQMGLPVSSWFRAMSLLDMYCHSGGYVNRDNVESFCTSLALIVAKFEGECFLGPNDCANSEELNLKEREILEVLQFRIRCPTICSWLNIFLSRLGVMMRDQQWHPVIEEIVYHYAQVFVTHNSCVPDSNLRKVAHGLIGIACVATANRFVSAISHPCSLPEHLQNELIGIINEDMDVLVSDFEMVSLSLTLEPLTHSQRTFVTI
jgi:hypothetical protein